jgi:hypothetical protein
MNWLKVGSQSSTGSLNASLNCMLDYLLIKFFDTLKLLKLEKMKTAFNNVVQPVVF